MSSSASKTVLAKIREAFSQPVSYRKHDAYFVFSILRALDQIDKMKWEVPLLGKMREIDYDTARESRVLDEASNVEAVSQKLVEQFEGLPIWGHPLTQINVSTSLTATVNRHVVSAAFLT